MSNQTEKRECTINFRRDGSINIEIHHVLEEKEKSQTPVQIEREKAPDKLCKIGPFLERPYMGEQVDTYIYTKELQDALKLFRSKQGEQR